jgi:hypothetical protein
VTLDGQPVDGVTPLTLPNLQVGQAYKLAISLPGHQTLNDTIVVKDGQPIQRMLTLVQAVGSLTVLSTPPGAAISIDGVMRGLAPVTVDGIDSSRPHPVTATLSGYQSATVAAAWGQGESKSKTISLPLAPLSRAVAPKVTEAPKPANAAVFGSPIMPAAVSKKPAPAAPRAAAPRPGAQLRARAGRRAVLRLEQLARGRGGGGGGGCGGARAGMQRLRGRRGRVSRPPSGRPRGGRRAVA